MTSLDYSFKKVALIDAENVGRELQKQIDNITVEDASIKRKSILQSLQPEVNIECPF